MTSTIKFLDLVFAIFDLELLAPVCFLALIFSGLTVDLLSIMIVVNIKMRAKYFFEKISFNNSLLCGCRVVVSLHGPDQALQKQHLD